MAKKKRAKTKAKAKPAGGGAHMMPGMGMMADSEMSKFVRRHTGRK